MARTASKLASANGNAIASACWNSIGSSGRNFFRATSSIGGLVGRDQPRRRRQQVAQAPRDYAGPGAGLQHAGRGVTGDKARGMPGVVGKDDRPKPAVVIFRDVTDEPCRIVAHTLSHRYWMTTSTRAHRLRNRPRALAVFRLAISSKRIACSTGKSSALAPLS